MLDVARVARLAWNESFAAPFETREHEGGRAGFIGHRVADFSMGETEAVLP